MATCYRHPGRETNVACSACERPICTECMTAAPVGMRCPECAGERTKARTAGSTIRPGGAPATYALIGICVAAFLATMASGGAAALDGGGELILDGGLYGPAVEGGEPYRLVTAGFLHAGLFHLLLNMFALYILGMLLEPGIGTARFLGIYAVSLLGGSFGALLLDPRQVTVGASGAIFGLMAATFIVARGRGMQGLASQIAIFVAINLVFTVSIPGISIGGHLGGLIVGGIAGLVVSGVERRHLPSAGAIEAVTMAALGAVAIAGSLLVAGSATGLA